MKYKDTEPIEIYRCDFFWYMTDHDAREFALCERCRTEAPLAEFQNEWRCQICASTITDKNGAKASAGPLNVALTIMGYFDEVEVLFAKDHIPGYEEIDE